MKLIRALAAIALVASPLIAHAQVSDHDDPMGETPMFEMYDSTLTGNNVFTADTAWGSAVADLATDRIYIPNDGGISEYSISEQMAIVGYPGQSIGSIQALVPRDIFTSESEGGPDFGPCDMSPCRSYYDPMEGKYIWTVPVGEPDPYLGMDPTIRENLENDARDFEQARQRRCEDFNDSLVNSSLEAPATGGACALAETVIGGVICVGGIGKQLWDAAKRYRASVDCNASYPGPGKWNGSRLPANYGK